MTKIKPFDPIVVVEANARMSRHGADIRDGQRGADALLWFNEFGWDQSSELVLKVSAKLVASSTPRALEAQHYISQAAARFADQILAAAIAEAKAEFDVGAARTSKGQRS